MSEGLSWGQRRRSAIRLEPVPTAPRAARQFAAQALHGIAQAALAADVTVVVSELVTNAIRHTRAPIHLTVQTSIDGVRLEVYDGSPRLPDLPVPGLHAEGGRGLAIVSSLADAWGADPIPGDGKIVQDRLG